MTRTLREKMVFAPQDLVADPPLTNLDLVTCRNLLIYLNPATAKRVLYLVHSALRTGGYLFLGKGETLSPRQTGFEVVSGEWRIYRKTGPLSEIKLRFPSRPEKIRNATALAANAHLAVAEGFNLPSVLIDDRFQILRVYGESDLLRVPAGEPAHNLLEVTLPQFVPDLKQAAKAALASHQSVTVVGLSDGKTGELTLSMRLTPLQTGEHGGAPRLLVSFVRNPGPPDPVQPVHSSGTPVKAAAVEEDERSWGEAMRISHQELEASREELQVLNEELKATNDQLNSSNEDLNTANGYLQEKIAELEMQSRVLSSGGVTTLFLDEELRVRWFTQAVRDLYPLLPQDTGRLITDFVPNFADNNFTSDVREVMQTGEVRSGEVRARDGRWSQREIRPHLSKSQQMSGVAVTFSDVTARKKADEALRESQTQLGIELSDTRELHRVSSRLIKDEDIDTLYSGILEAARRLMRSEMASIHKFVPERQGLLLLAEKGFVPASAQFWQWVDAGRMTSCGLGLARHEPLIVPDIERWDVIAGAEDLRYYRLNGTRAMLSMPLTSRNGQLVGVMSTHWIDVHQPSERELRLLHLLARQAADLLERTRAEEVVAEEFRNTRVLQDLSARLVTEENIQAIYEAILMAAIEITRAVAGTVQMLDLEAEELVVLATRGFSHGTREYFHRVDASSNTSCGLALRTGGRTYFDFDPSSTDVSVRKHVADGVLAAQSSPLISRSGKPIGMVSTYWTDAGHRPSERDLRFLDLLARQAADVIEQRRAESALVGSMTFTPSGCEIPGSDA